MKEQLFAFGLKSEISNDLLSRFILDKQFIHTSYDYGSQLDYLKDTSNKINIKLNLIYKVYLNFYDISSDIRLPLLLQVERVYEKLEPYLDKLILQISSVPANKNFSSKDISNFLNISFNKYKVTYFFVESFVESERYVKRLLIKLMKARDALGLEKDIYFGVTSYESPSCKGFSEKMIEFVNLHKLYYMPMRIFRGSNNRNSIDLALNKVSLESRYSNFFRAITSTTNYEHYKKLSAMRSEEINTFNKYSYLANHIIASNPYGICYDDNIRKKTKIKIIMIKSFLKRLVFIFSSRSKFKKFKDLFVIIRAGFI